MESSISKFLEIVERAYTGKPVPIRKWDYEIVPSETRKILKEHDLENTYDKENPVNTDLRLADDFWEAGFELALRLGMYCPDTERRIMFSEEEIEEAIRNAPSEGRLGFGKDAVIFRKRAPENRTPPVTAMSALGLEVSEELYIPICQSIAQHECVDSLLGCTLATVYGHENRSRSPIETVAGMYEAQLVKEALRRAGRPGMPVWGVEGAPTEYGHFGGFCPGGFEPERTIGIALFPEPAKLPLHVLHRVAQTKNGGYPLEAGHMLCIYGYFGPPEGGVVGSIAVHLLEVAATQPFVVESSILDARYYGNAGREALWANSVTYQARSRNSRAMDIGFLSQVNGCVTDMLLYESAVVALTDAVSGASVEIGTRPAACRYRDHCSSVENKFSAEVLKATVNLKLTDVNEIVKSLIKSIPGYEDKLFNPSKGKSFRECMDLETLQPTKDWSEIYERVWRELEDLGVLRPES